MCQIWEVNCGLWVLNDIIKKTYTESLKKIMGAVWEFNHFIKNPQTTIALPFLTHNISATGGVCNLDLVKLNLVTNCDLVTIYQRLNKIFRFTGGPRIL